MRRGREMGRKDVTNKNEGKNAPLGEAGEVYGACAGKRKRLE